MAIDSLKVFSEYLYKGAIEILAQEITNLIRSSKGAINITPAAHQGDFAEKATFQRISNLVRRRNQYGTGAVAGTNLAHLLDTMVKVAAGTPPVEMDPAQFKWIQRSPKEAAVAMAFQLAEDTLADMLNTGLGAAYAALASEAEVIHDGSAATLTHAAMHKGTSKLGDRSGAIKVWVGHSTPLHDLMGSNIQNVERLFSYGSINISSDPFGRILISTDSDSLVEVDGVGAGIDKYHTLGLVADAIYIGQNNDYTDNFETKNGQENIGRTFQAEWTYNIGLKGFAWDKTNGGKSPTDAALFVSSNWDRYSTSKKDLLGVVVESR